MGNPNNPSVPQEAIDALSRKVNQFVWPHRAIGAAQPGFTIERLRPMIEYWRKSFDWRTVEARFEQLGQFTTTTADGRRLHGFHARGDGEHKALLLVHGWPDSPLRFTDLIPRLIAAGHDVIAPAIPGFGFSSEPAGEISPELIAEDFHNLMIELGYSRYAIHGGDLGSGIATTLASAHPEAVIALHLTDMPFHLAFMVDRNTASDTEVNYLENSEKFADSQLYLKANMQQPDIVALALADTPVGLLAWLAHLYDQAIHRDATGWPLRRARTARTTRRRHHWLSCATSKLNPHQAIEDGPIRRSKTVRYLFITD